jgi:hypothetical protein
MAEVRLVTFAKVALRVGQARAAGLTKQIFETSVPAAAAARDLMLGAL